MSDHVGAKIVYPALPNAKILISDRGYGSDAWRGALKAMRITPCIPPIPSRKTPIEFDKALYKQRHKVENTFNRLKDWRRIATRYDRCADLFMAAIILFWCDQWVWTLNS